MLRRPDAPSDSVRRFNAPRSSWLRFRSRVLSNGSNTLAGRFVPVPDQQIVIRVPLGTSATSVSSVTLNPAPGRFSEMVPENSCTSRGTTAMRARSEAMSRSRMSTTYKPSPIRFLPYPFDVE
jgi:hypothetical protein